MFEYESKGLLEITFGETQDAGWKLLAAEIGGEFIPGVRDGWGSTSRVIYRVEDWAVTLEAYKYGTSAHPGIYVMHTRIIADYITDDYFSFSVSTPGLLDELKGFFGLENKYDIKIGDPDLDRKYVFYGTDVEQMRQLFENTNLRRMLTWLGNVSYGVKGVDEWLSKTYRKKSFQLYYHHPHLVYDTVRLRVIMELFGETLKQLRHIGSII